MATAIDNILLDETNVEFNYASDFVKHTDRLVYLTGKAGTGKTTFLKYLRETTTKNTVILAPTGVAAINAGGQTIHSFFQLPFGPFILNDKRLRTSKDLGDLDDTTIYSTFRYREDKKIILEKLELLIIDEKAELLNDIFGINEERADKLLDICITSYHKNNQLHACLKDVIDECKHTTEVVFTTMMMSKIIEKNNSKERLGGLLKNLFGHD